MSTPDPAPRPTPDPTQPTDDPRRKRQSDQLPEEAPDGPPDGEDGKPPEEHDPPPHDEHAREPLGPFTPDDETPAGDSPEVHDGLSPHDLPKDHPGRKAAEKLAEDEGGTTSGNQ